MKLIEVMPMYQKTETEEERDKKKRKREKRKRDIQPIYCKRVFK